MIRVYSLQLLLSNIARLLSKEAISDWHMRQWLKAEIKHYFYIFVFAKNNKYLCKLVDYRWKKYRAGF